MLRLSQKSEQPLFFIAPTGKSIGSFDLSPTGKSVGSIDFAPTGKSVGSILLLFEPTDLPNGARR
jgi:hypothetical protein